MKMKKRFLGILLSLVMVLGMVPGMSLTALAAGTTITWDTILSNRDIYTGMSPHGIVNYGTIAIPKNVTTGPLTKVV